MIDGLLVEDQFFSDLVSRHLKEYAEIAGTQQEMQVAQVPGIPPIVSPEWILQELFNLKMDNLRINLQLIITRYILEGISETGTANKEDSDIQGIFKMVEQKVNTHMVKFTKATTSKKKPSTIVMPGNGRLPPDFMKGKK